MIYIVITPFYYVPILNVIMVRKQTQYFILIPDIIENYDK